MSLLLNFSGKSFALSSGVNVQQQIVELFDSLSIDCTNLSYKSNGKPIHDFQTISKDHTIIATIPLLGGKGGFGAKLKNQGGKKVKPNDNKFSRDAHGRRIQYQMAQTQYTEFIKKKIQEDQKVNKQRELFKVMQETMKQGHSFMKMDKKYNEQVEQAQNKLTESIRIGRQRLIQKRLIQKNKYQDCEKKEIPRQEEKRQTSERQKQEYKQEDQIYALEKPIKKVKVQSECIKAAVNQKPQKPALTLVSAKDKLKSLFKK